MSRRGLAVLAAAFGALLAAWGLARLLGRAREERAALWAPGLSAVRLRLGDVQLARAGGSWREVQPMDYPADEALLQDVLDRLPKVEVGDYLTDSPARYPLFQVTDSSGLRFSAWTAGDKPALDLVVGKTGSNYDTFYFRDAAGMKVFEARGLPRYLIDRKPGDWLSKLIVSVESDRIKTLTVRGAAGTLSLSRKDKQWLLAGSPLSEAAVTKTLQPMLVSLIRLEADELAPASSAPSDAFRKPSLTLELQASAPDGKPLSVRLTAGKAGPIVWLKSDGESKVVFKLSGWKLDPFRKTAKDFKAAG